MLNPKHIIYQLRALNKLISKYAQASYEFSSILLLIDKPDHEFTHCKFFKTLKGINRFTILSHLYSVIPYTISNNRVQ